MRNSAFTPSIMTPPDVVPARAPADCGGIVASVVNVLLFDLDYRFQVGAFETRMDRGRWDALESRVEANTGRVLDLFARAGVRGTFPPWLGPRRAGPHSSAASHSGARDRQPRLGPQTRPPHDPGRVPQRQRPHAILAHAGYAYLSSVAPIAHDHYDWPEAPRFAHRPLADAELIELPVTTARVGTRRLAAVGAASSACCPTPFRAGPCASLTARAGPPCSILTSEKSTPASRASPTLRSRLRHYSRLGAMEAKLESLLREFRWDRTDCVVAAEAARLGA